HTGSHPPTHPGNGARTKPAVGREMGGGQVFLKKDTTLIPSFLPFQSIESKSTSRIRLLFFEKRKVQSNSNRKHFNLMKSNPTQVERNLSFFKKNQVKSTCRNQLFFIRAFSNTANSTSPSF